MSTVVKDLGAVSAYAYAVEKGYTGTEAEFAELMASYATVGQTAVTAAQTSTTKASEAATSATTATNKASEATTAAQTATTKAGEASTSASTATSAKDTAVSASQTATTKATEATTAAATAVSAKDDAVSANTAAQSAKTAAQTAQTGAETAAASVQASAAQIQTNAEDISELKEDLTHAFPHDTVSGAVASFTDGADDVPMDSVVVSIDPVQSGSGDPSPTNVRPISGWSEVNVQRTGKNLIELSPTTQTVNGVTFTVNDDGTISLSGTATQNTNYFLSSGERSFINGSFVLSGCPSGGSASTYYLRIDNATGGVLAADYGDGRQFTISDGKIYTVFINVKSGVNTNGLVFKPMIELGTTATTYEPYSGQSVKIALGQTVYGGTLDVTNGVLTIDNGYTNKDNVGKVVYTLNGNNVWLMEYDAASIGSTEVSAISSVLKQGNYNGIYAGESNIVAQNSQGRLLANVDGISSVSDIDTWLNANPDFLVVYKLATPITVQLTPHEVSSLLGSNNVWADTGDSTVEYRADPTLYIGRLTEPDADMVADANITSGSYFMVGNTLYKATANIASGATISPNVNCTRKSLSEALNELNA